MKRSYNQMCSGTKPIRNIEDILETFLLELFTNQDIKSQLKSVKIFLKLYEYPAIKLFWLDHSFDCLWRALIIKNSRLFERHQLCYQKQSSCEGITPLRQLVGLYKYALISTSYSISDIVKNTEGRCNISKEVVLKYIDAAEYRSLDAAMDLLFYIAYVVKNTSLKLEVPLIHSVIENCLGNLRAPGYIISGQLYFYIGLYYLNLSPQNLVASINYFKLAFTHLFIAKHIESFSKVQLKNIYGHSSIKRAIHSGSVFIDFNDLRLTSIIDYTECLLIYIREKTGIDFDLKLLDESAEKKAPVFQELKLKTKLKSSSLDLHEMRNSIQQSHRFLKMLPVLDKLYKKNRSLRLLLIDFSTHFESGSGLLFGNKRRRLLRDPQKNLEKNHFIFYTSGKSKAMTQSGVRANKKKCSKTDNSTSNLTGLFKRKDAVCHDSKDGSLCNAIHEERVFCGT